MNAGNILFLFHLVDMWMFDLWNSKKTNEIFLTITEDTQELRPGGWEWQVIQEPVEEHSTERVLPVQKAREREELEALFKKLNGGCDSSTLIKAESGSVWGLHSRVMPDHAGHSEEFEFYSKGNIKPLIF